VARRKLDQKAELLSSTGHQAKLHRGRGEKESRVCRNKDLEGSPDLGETLPPRPRFALAKSAAPAGGTWGQGRDREEEHPRRRISFGGLALRRWRLAIVGGSELDVPVRSEK